VGTGTLPIEEVISCQLHASSGDRFNLKSVKRGADIHDVVSVTSIAQLDDRNQAAAAESPEKVERNIEFFTDLSFRPESQLIRDA
jgi:hypothetical protein